MPKIFDAAALAALDSEHALDEEEAVAPTNADAAVLPVAA